MTTPLFKPRVLRSGATLAVLSPASTPKPELVERGMAYLQRLGYKTVLSPHALDSGPLYYAGKLEDRLRDLHAAFANPEIDGIVCTRGGWGSAELLPHLDAKLIRSNPKPFIGYSDHTSLHCWLHNEANLTTFYGPMVAADFSREDGVDLASWQHSLTGDHAWALGEAEGLRVLRAGQAEGWVAGGCLSIFAEGLGTPYAPHIERKSILFLEDIGTKPYQWDRMLLHLRYAGILEHVTGIVFGDMGQNVSPEEADYLEQAILHALREFDGPIAVGLRCGHVSTYNVTLPLGVAARLDLSDARNPRMHLLEAAVNG
ncbi:S66 peptidase family protein [Tunturibacter empetritectus]|uniref:Muramoyltetrapeptide carboxypeptidase n=1 Tax=Tunturiibacter empetritectus TaxID=3069691 RepID=A0A7W8IMR4_9BACT|nr:LD-carboxypeptidase [Edaphobacter lichenicola]MBB5319028.1 muramoyltetrapeptide carboxypeptidase [Edaphobacter lichenicola]